MKTIDPEFRQKSRWRRGAPYGNTNALKHGRTTKEKRALRKRIAQWRRITRALIAQAEQALERRPSLSSS